jgi:hypothetical protein
VSQSDDDRPSDSFEGDDTVDTRWGTHRGSPTHHAVQAGTQTTEPGEATAACGESLDEIGPEDDPFDPLRDDACGRCAQLAPR